jgi:hypothetical protein
MVLLILALVFIFAISFGICLLQVDFMVNWLLLSFLANAAVHGLDCRIKWQNEERRIFKALADDIRAFNAGEKPIEVLWPYLESPHVQRAKSIYTDILLFKDCQEAAKLADQALKQNIRGLNHD